MEALIPRLERQIVVDENGCWIWTGSRLLDGYGRVFAMGRRWRVHRLVYTLLREEIPDGLDLDHLCRVRACCNPEHLEPVTRGENSRRGDTGIVNRRKTHCPKGHPYDGTNTDLDGHGWRGCRECRRERQRGRYQRRKAQRRGR